MPTPQASQYAATYTTFSGCDIKAVFGNVTIGEIQAISVQVTREKAGIYTMGSPNPRSFSRGKRGIAGSLIFIQFDRDAILYALRDLKFMGDIEELRVEATDGTDRSLTWAIRSASSVTAQTPIGGGVGESQASMETQQELELTSIDSDQDVFSAFYADQIPPFDITLVAANEYGDMAKMGIFGAEFLNEGWGISIDDLATEKQYTYLCRDVSWWQWVRNPKLDRLRGRS